MIQSIFVVFLEYLNPREFLIRRTPCYKLFIFLRCAEQFFVLIHLVFNLVKSACCSSFAYVVTVSLEILQEKRPQSLMSQMCMPL
jgi:hypothetical protein